MLLPTLRKACNAPAQISGAVNSREPCWLLPLRRTAVRRNGYLTPRFRQHFYTRLRNGKAFWFNLPLLSYKVFLLSFNFFYLPTNSPRLYDFFRSFGDFSSAFSPCSYLRHRRCLDEGKLLLLLMSKAKFCKWEPSVLL